MELLKLLGIVIVIAGFALKLDSILVILVAAVVTALVGGLGPVTLLETLGSGLAELTGSGHVSSPPCVGIVLAINGWPA